MRGLRAGELIGEGGDRGGDVVGERPLAVGVALIPVPKAMGVQAVIDTLVGMIAGEDQRA